MRGRGNTHTSYWEEERTEEQSRSKGGEEKRRDEGTGTGTSLNESVLSRTVLNYFLSARSFLLAMLTLPPPTRASPF